MIMTKFRNFLTAVATFAVPSLIWAVPADPRPRTVTNPDGTTVSIRMHGDEHFHFMTDADCTTIMQRNADGFVVNALRNGTPLSFTKANVEMLRAEKEAASLTRAGESAPQRMAALDSEGRSTYPTIGEGNRSLVVLVEFQDQEFTVENPKEYFTRQLNEPGFSDYGGKGSAVDYFKAVSNGKYVPQFDVYGPVKISKNTTYFADDNYKTKNMELLIQEALTALHDSGELNLSNYDFDNNGTLDTVFIYYAGFGSADSDTQTIWPHQSTYWGSTLRFDGIKVGPYACANELKGWNPNNNTVAGQPNYVPWIDGVGTFIHEYGHVLGLPDMYDVDYTGAVETPGDWDVMDSGCYNFDGCVPPLYSAYEQWVCNWLDYTEVEDGSHYDLASLGTTPNSQAVRIRIPMNADKTKFNPEYFIIESRDNTGWDSCFPSPGLMVWRINYNKNLWTSNSVNSINNGSNVQIVLAKSAKNPLFNDGSIYPGGDAELVPSKNYALWESPIITGIGYDSNLKVGSFDYNAMTQPDVATVLHDAPLAAADGSRSFTLEWDPVEGVDSYLVTVKTVKNEKIIDNYDAKDMGTDTRAVISGLSSVYWKLEMQAYVQCVVGGMVSSNKSNVITFKPSELNKAEDDNAVEGIESDNVQISGGIGCVIAPEGAVIYNMSGQQLRNENLTPGIYLVSFGSNTAKVLVR